MALTSRRRRALEDICRTFAPWSVELGVPDAMLETVERVSSLQRRRLELLLGWWDSRVLGRGRRFGAMSQAEREAVLLRWCDSRSPQRRAAFQGLRSGVLTLAYMLAPNPRWEAIGYLGPPGPVAAPPPRALSPVRPDAGTRIDCDVCVVGSGAGGGVAAAVLAEAGLEVVVLEAGGYFDDADFDGGERAGFRRLYLDGGAATTLDGGIGLLAGSCLGGGTVVNYTTSFATPEDVRDEWAALGATAFASDDYSRSLDAVAERLDVNVDESRPSPRDEVLRRGLERLGWHSAPIPRNVRGCDQGESCGFCGYGCRLGAKRSTAKTWLVDAERAGARLVVEAEAERIVREGGRLSVESDALTVRCRAVVVAAGALRTPVLLRRSGLRNAAIGRNLRLHPVTALLGVFDEEIRPWEGTLQAVYSDEHRNLDGAYGVKYETAPAHPSLLAAFLPWRGAEAHARAMEELPRLGLVGVLLRDRGSGSVDARGRVRYRLDPGDASRLETSTASATSILEAAGATRIGSAHARGLSYEPDVAGSRQRFLAAAAREGFAAGRCVVYSFHQMGSARMGGSPRSSAADAEGRLWEEPEIVVCDGSAFPTSSGVNPMVTIQALAHLNATRLAERLAR